MSRLPGVTGRRVVRALQRAGFQVVRTHGSHFLLRHPDGRTPVVAVYAGETLGPGVLTKILRDAEMTPDEFPGLLR